MFCGKINRELTNKSERKARELAYAQTGRQMLTAKKAGGYVAGSAAYHKNLRQNMKKVRQNSQDRDHFINDL